MATWREYDDDTWIRHIWKGWSRHIRKGVNALSLMSQSRSGYVDRPQSSSLADVVEVILDKGLVIDAYINVSVLGVTLLTIDARVVIASVDTYLRFAEATNRLDLSQTGGTALPDLKNAMIEGAVKGKVSGTIAGIKEGFTE